MVARKRVFISFDYDNDRRYRDLLNALKENKSSDIEFEDLTPGEIDTDDVGRIKAVLSERINRSTHTLVIIGSHANSFHPDREEIGARNWQWWEIQRTKNKSSPKFIAVKINRENSPPEPLRNQGAEWAHSFKVDSIIAAIDRA